MTKSSKRRGFHQQPRRRSSRKLFLIAAEGRKTEPQYFGIFRNRSSRFQIKWCKGASGSDPRRVLKRMEKCIDEHDLGPNDEAWIVMDKDNWSEQQLAPLAAWVERRDNCYLALSNPKFEYWLLLHFEAGKGVRTSRDCDERLRRCRQGHDKGIDAGQFTPERIEEAVRRGKQQDRPPCKDWPRTPGVTTVYRLVEKLS